MSATFRKDEKLCYSSLISKLFAEGDSFFCYPFKVIWLLLPDDGQPALPQVMMSVPKKKHKRANKRNLLKRRTREAYRLNKESLLEMMSNNGRKLIFALIYTETAVLEYQAFDNSLKFVIPKLKTKVSRVTQAPKNENLDSHHL